jgi:hypothetical protein
MVARSVKRRAFKSCSGFEEPKNQESNMFGKTLHDWSRRPEHQLAHMPPTAPEAVETHQKIINDAAAALSLLRKTVTLCIRC